ncbi:MAG: hypothetical protein WC655_11960 [Candidatus Hydrogenedentales bacterium]|jgi:hypothetical protein
MNKQSIAEQLLAQEKPSANWELRYRKEMEAMMERNLKPWERVLYVLVTIMCLSFFVVFGVAAVLSWGDLPLLSTIGFALGSLFGLAFALISIGVMKRGRFNFKRDTGKITGLVWIFMIGMMTIFLVQGQQMKDTGKGTQLILVGLVFFVTFGVVGMLQYNIQQSELRVRESMLKIELQLAELAERLLPKG